MLVTKIKFPSFAKTTFTYESGQKLQSVLNYDGPVIVAIDPSKTAMGVTIGTLTGGYVEFLILSGKGMDTTEFCIEFKEFFLQYLRPEKIEMVVYEKVIKRDDEKGSYVSMVVLNEIQSHLIELVRVTYGDKSRLFGVNNWAWKAAVLPKEYRTKNSGKGSYKYLCNINPRFTTCDDNITDSICIYIYYMSRFYKPAETEIYPTSEELRDDVSIILSTSDTLPEKYSTFRYNPSISVKGNASYAKNRIAGISACPIDGSELSIRDVYDLTTNIGKAKDFYLVVN